MPNGKVVAAEVLTAEDPSAGVVTEVQQCRSLDETCLHPLMGESWVESTQTLVMTARSLLYSRTLGAGHDSCGNRGDEGEVSQLI